MSRQRLPRLRLCMSCKREIPLDTPSYFSQCRPCFRDEQDQARVKTAQRAFAAESRLREIESTPPELAAKELQPAAWQKLINVVERSAHEDKALINKMLQWAERMRDQAAKE
jgi:hypothetical protein